MLGGRAFCLDYLISFLHLVLCTSGSVVVSVICIVEKSFLVSHSETNAIICSLRLELFIFRNSFIKRSPCSTSLVLLGACMSLAREPDKAELLIQTLHSALKMAAPESLTAHLIQMAILNEATDDGTVSLGAQESK